MGVNENYIDHRTAKSRKHKPGSNRRDAVEKSAHRGVPANEIVYHLSDIDSHDGEEVDKGTYLTKRFPTSRRYIVNANVTVIGIRQFLSVSKVQTSLKPTSHKHTITKKYNQFQQVLK